ncbi:MAG: XRE family transcriptional regulator [Spirochaetia bacterium]|nr:XRE family transcriptional regulator [Spirochaetia bacterium]
MDIHLAIQHILTEKNITISAVSRESGLTRSYIYKVLSGRHSPTIYTLSRFAEALEMPLSELIMVAEGDGFI